MTGLEDRADKLAATLARAEAIVAGLHEERLELIRLMRSTGWSYGDIGRAIGVSRQRVEQLAAYGQHRPPARREPRAPRVHPAAVVPHPGPFDD